MGPLIALEPDSLERRRAEPSPGPRRIRTVGRLLRPRDYRLHLGMSRARCKVGDVLTAA
jgi:hypothetical protein